MSTTTTSDSLVTPGDIALALGERVQRVRYILDSRPDIRPVRRAGIVRLFEAGVVERVRHEFEEIDQRRRPVRAGNVNAVHASAAGNGPGSR